MKRNIIIFISIVLFGLWGCNNYWEDYYNIYPDTVDKNLWDALNEEQGIDQFIQILKDFNYDSLLFSDDTYTIFVPTNAALAEYLAANQIDTMQIKYLIAPNFVQSEDIGVKRNVQTLGKKFALLENNGGVLLLDGIALEKESPLYRNGKYFVMNELATPKPNLYEFFVSSNPVLSAYINSLDSVVLDLEKSKPTGFDENGNTVYDSVSYIYNEFEEYFFPVRSEFRNQTATIVFPNEEIYQAALTEMALKMQIPGYTDYSHISNEWQQRVLIPILLNQGIFENKLKPKEFSKSSELDTLMLKIIKGDSIPVFYTPVDKQVCSNGYAYNYQEFTIPDSLYLGSSKFEGEWLLQQTGVNKYLWKEEVNIISDQRFDVKRELNPSASNDSILSVLFPTGYSGNFSVEFYTENLFPRKYLMVVRTNMNYGGVYEIYVNDELVKTFDYFDFVRFQGLMPSVTGKRYLPEGSFNRFDLWVDNITEYGKAKIKFKYKSPGYALGQGFILDYIDFIPANQ